MESEVGHAIGHQRGKVQETSEGKTVDEANAAFTGRELQGIDILALLGDGSRHRLSEPAQEDAAQASKKRPEYQARHHPRCHELQFQPLRHKGWNADRRSGCADQMWCGNQQDRQDRGPWLALECKQA